MLLIWVGWQQTTHCLSASPPRCRLTERVLCPPSSWPGSSLEEGTLWGLTAPLRLHNVIGVGVHPLAYSLPSSRVTFYSDLLISGPWGLASKSVGSLCCTERRWTCSFCYWELNISSATLMHPSPLLSFRITLKLWCPCQCHEAQLYHLLLDFMQRRLFSLAQTPSWLLPVWRNHGFTKGDGSLLKILLRSTRCMDRYASASLRYLVHSFPVFCFETVSYYSPGWTQTPESPPASDAPDEYHYILL